MKLFIPSTNKNFSFSSCESCDALCCSGINGSIYSQLTLNDFYVSEYFPILFIFGDLGFVKPIVLLTDGVKYCRYVKDMKCSIYEKRPNVCKNYPLSPHLDDNIYIDLTCPATSEINPNEDNQYVKNNILKDKKEYFEEYKDTYLETHFEFENLKKEDFTKILTLKGIDYFAYLKQSDNKYIKLHQDSLIHLENDYFKSLI